jgi:putative integral membrane protein (TIGR02587 family)
MKTRSRPRLFHPRVGRAWSDELDDAVRGLASGLLVGVPVTFTVDSWWLGDQIGPLDSLFLLGFSYLLTLAVVFWIGFHRGVRRGWSHFADALEALALAVLALIAVLWSVGQIGDGQAASIVVGRIAMGTAPVSIGVAVANHLLALDDPSEHPGSDTAPTMPDEGSSGWRLTLKEIGAAAAGALFVCLAFVPVDDLGAIVTEVPFRNVPLVIFLSLLVSYSIVFAAGLAGESKRHATPGLLQTPFAETVLAYVTAVLVSLGMLWIFGHIDSETAPIAIYTKTVLLAFPASMAAAAGRLAV